MTKRYRLLLAGAALLAGVSIAGAYQINGVDLGLPGHQPLALAPATPAGPQATAWEQYVVAPRHRDLRPVAVLSVAPGAGAAGSPERLTDPAAPPLRLESTGADGPVLTLDFGQVISGKPEITVLAHSDPAPSLLLSFSEARAFLAPGSDTNDYATGDLTYAPEMAGTWTAPSRRSFRYLRLAITSPGWVELGGVGLYFTAHLGTPEALRGSFLSSDDQLNRIWYRGAYTLDLVTAPGSGSACDGNWELVRNRVHAWDCGARREFLAVGGEAWSDALAEFQVELIPGGRSAGWLLRAGPDQGYRFELLAGTPSVLKRAVRAGGKDQPLPDVPLPFAVTPGKTYKVTAEARGPRITTSLDGQVVDTFEDGSLTKGSAGLLSGPGANFFAGPMTVRDGAGAVLLADDFAGRNPPVPDCARWMPQGLAPRQWAPLCGPALLDGAKRDRAVSAADVVIAGRSTYATAFRTDVVRASLHHLAFALLPPPTALQEFPLWWVIALNDYYMATGDADYVRTVLYRAPEILDGALALRDRRGLVVRQPGCDHIDWYWSLCNRHGAVTATNALLVGALETGATLLESMGDTAKTQRYRQEAATTRAAMGPLWDAAAGAWADSDTDRVHHPLDGNALAVLFGVRPDLDGVALDGVRRLLWTPWGSRTAETAYTTERQFHDLSIWTVYMYYEVLARFQHGDDAGAIEALRRGWGNMLQRDPASTFWEWAGPDGETPRGFTSLAHGWSTGAVDALTGMVVGVRPESPAFRTWSVRPHPGELAWVQGRVPTPNGSIDVAWRQDVAGHSLQITVAAPDGTKGTIAVPKLGLARVAVLLNGGTVWDGRQASGPDVQARDDGKYVVIGPLAGGKHEVSSAPAQ